MNKKFFTTQNMAHAISLASYSSQSANIYSYDSERAYASELRIQYTCMEYWTLLAEIGMPNKSLFCQFLWLWTKLALGFGSGTSQKKEKYFDKKTNINNINLNSNNIF